MTLFLYVYKVTFVCLRGKPNSYTGRGDKSPFKWEPCILEEKEALGVYHNKKLQKRKSYLEIKTIKVVSAVTL